LLARSAVETRWPYAGAAPEASVSV
jgi:hypothetical protein